MTISVGDRLPSASFRIMTENGPAQITGEALFGGKRVVLFGVPGAFTPTCHMNHLPGFIEHHDTIKARGVDEIAVIAVNDVWVMSEWARATRAADKLRFLADGAAEFTRAVGLEADMTAAGMGLRSRRYSMIVEDGIVAVLNVEEKRGVAEISGAARILQQI